MKEKISARTIIRTLCLILALTNLTLETMGKKVLPIDDEQISELVTLIFTIATAVVGFWKNNSFTQEAIICDGIMRDLKKQNALNELENETIEEVIDETIEEVIDESGADNNG